eukprot:7381809-Prymnesium_polylepis.1
MLAALTAAISCTTHRQRPCCAEGFMRLSRPCGVLDRIDRLYDSCLINYYDDGKLGMRFHSDPGQARARTAAFTRGPWPTLAPTSMYTRTHTAPAPTGRTHTRTRQHAHADPRRRQGGPWGYSTTVVSVGDARLFVFRGADAKERKCSFAVRHGDAV